MTNNERMVVKNIVKRFGISRSHLMNIARATHHELGYLSEETVGTIAEAMGIDRVDVRDMATFYTFFSRKPTGKNVIRLCNAVAENMAGARDIAREFEQVLGISFGETTPDGLFSLEYTSCIGLSDQAPSALINGKPLANLCRDDVQPLLDALRNNQEFEKIGKVDSHLVMPGQVLFSGYIRGKAIYTAIKKTPEEVIADMNASRLRGRGGAGFPLALKWNFCRKAPGKEHYVVCNGDEGEPGTFKDRVILSEIPDLLFEGMTIAAYAIGAKRGYLYLRAEYEYLLEGLEIVLARRRSDHLLGENIAGKTGFDFDIEIQLGAGAYICGEESALLESLEGKRGAPRDRPPFPVQCGYLREPTAVNNIETLCCAARVVENGPDWFSSFGTKDSTGTKLLSISGDCQRAGIYEVEFGVCVEEILEMVGAENAQAVQVGGPSGQCLAPKDFGRSIAFEDLSTGGSFIIFGLDRDLLRFMHEFVEFFKEESCGWCAPCRVGTVQLAMKMQKIMEGKACQRDIEELESLASTVKTMSRCGLGQTAANPVLSTLTHFPDLYQKKLQGGEYSPTFDIDKAVQVGCEAAERKRAVETAT
jgi:[NiFe] hydrogenase diaphorase moiety large subunit